MRPGPRLRHEDGISLVVAICSLMIMIMLAGIALPQAVQSLIQSEHQKATKRALQAADAGIDAAVYRLARLDLGGTLNINALDPTSLTTQNCVISRGDLAGGIGVQALDMALPPDPNGRRWCPVTSPEAVGDGSTSATYRYRISQLLRVGSGNCGDGSPLSLDREIVSEGTANGVTRRVHARLRASVALLSGAAVQSSSTGTSLTMSGTARVLGNVQANASIAGVATNVIAGNATPGPGKSVSGVIPAGSAMAACQPFVLPEVDQGDAPANNDNGLRSDGCVNLSGLLPISCKPLLTTTGGVTWDSARRSLTVWGNGRAILTGTTYSLCSLRIQDQGILQISAANPVTRIFLDDPANCKNPDGTAMAGAGQITMDGLGQIVNCHNQTQSQSLQVYAVGNSSTATTQTLAGAAPVTGTGLAALCGLSVTLTGIPMVLYAPHSRISLGGSTIVAGQVAGEVVSMSGASAVQPVNALININELGSNPVLPLYKPDSYLECTSATFETLPSNNPAQGC